MSLSKFFLRILLNQSRQAKKADGFTLLELLVAMILAVLVISPLLTLVLNLLNTDHQEQAKTSSQQEIQAAADYMAQDMQQAVYIYDATGLNKIQAKIPPQTPNTDSTGNTDPNCDPSKVNCVPVLAFWKRKYLDRTASLTGSGSMKIEDIKDGSQGSDRFVYSFVVYYLISDKTPDPTKKQWSQVARIGRFEISDGILNPNNSCSSGGTYNGNSYCLLPDQGFELFDTTSSGNVQTRMNSWKSTSSTSSYNKPVEILVDYIDNTPWSKFPTSVQTQSPLPTNDQNNGGTLTSSLCNQINGNSKNNIWGVVPPNTILSYTENPGSFYACVNSYSASGQTASNNTLGQSVAQIFLRGNTLARLSSDPTTWNTINNGNLDKQLSNRPVTNVRVSVRGSLTN